MPAQPDLVDLSSFGPDYDAAEAEGLKCFAESAVILVAGGLGERLGYHGIKLDIPVEVTETTSYLAHYASVIKAASSRLGRAIPLIIMTSRDTDEGTRATLAAHDWGVCVAWAAAGLLEREGALEGLIVINGPHIGAYGAAAGPAQYVRSLYIAAFQVPLLAELLLSREDGRLVEAMFLGKRMGVRARGGPFALTSGDVEVFKWGLRRDGGGGLTRALNWYRQLPDESRRDFAAAAPCPERPLRARVLCLWGADDGALGAEFLKVVVELLENPLAMLA
jgi:pimeloyl-ACP methyl ester carboxylesterase